MSENTPETAPKKEPSFWDSWPALCFLIAAIFFGRMALLEPFKIPSGSMEPTLSGHEDYGDRILTNKLAFVSGKWVIQVVAISLVLIGVGFFASKSYRSRKAIIITVLMVVGLCGGILFAWVDKAVASEPKRFDVTVFHYNTVWANENAPEQEINYIKRLVGLPGDTLTISGGDLYLRKMGKDEIVRKLDERPEFQQIAWYTVAKAWHKIKHHDINDVDRQRLLFPFDGAAIGTPGAKLTPHSLELDGTAPVTLTYKYPVTNICMKQGRWPFEHEKCPAVLPGVETDVGIMSNPNSKSKKITAYIGDSWEGVQCPNCNQVMFPPSANPAEGVALVPRQGGPNETTFFYGYSDEHPVGDLKLALEIDVQSPGAITLEVGSDLHKAVWNIPSSGKEKIEDSRSVHPVMLQTPQLSAGKHTLSLAYLDGAVIAILDGQEFERRSIAVSMPGLKAEQIKTIVKATFTGVRGTVTRLDIARDLHHIASDAHHWNRHKAGSSKQDGSLKFNVPEDHFLMMGDNAPSSADGRSWGYVPREKLVGRAWVIWWPPSRWRVIK